MRRLAWLFLFLSFPAFAGITPGVVDLTARAAALPPGALFDFAGTSCPSGSLIVPTTAGTLSRTTYAALFAAIGTTWGAGDGSTTFGRPWIAANYAAVQASANVGTASVGAVIAHTHDQNYIYGAAGSTYPRLAYSTDSPNLGAWPGAITGSTGGTANLAAGVRVLKCVKF